MHPIAVFVLLVLVGAMGEDPPVVEKFPDAVTYFGVKGDLSKLKWAHAVNSDKLLQEVFKDTTIQMIEADVRTGIKKPDVPDPGKPEVLPVDEVEIAVMKHSDSDAFDISLEDFVNKIKEHMKANKDRKLGLKLDFKTVKAFDLAAELGVFTEMPFPLWINADVLQGPGAAAPPEADITGSPALKSIFAGALYSFGWTTAAYQKPKTDPEPADPNKYSEANVAEMLAKIKPIEGKFTFPVRAYLVANGAEEVRGLLMGEHTLTVWSAEGDTEDFSEEMLRGLRDFLVEEKGRVFVDIPGKLQAAMDGLKGAGVVAVPAVGLVVAVVSGLLVGWF